MKDFEGLLSDVEQYRLQVEEKYQQKYQCGEFFNIFSVLGVQSDETRTHSAFIAELLNPKGSHGCGSLFLRAFANSFLQELSIDSDNLEKAEVKTEKFIGIKNEEQTEGGRIDIFITIGKLCIIIENKIYASDQYNQLLRYKEYAKKQEHKIFYLTLSGHDASESSTSSQLKVNEDYYLLSYKENILEWLDTCNKEAANRPLVRETIAQYINLIKELTNQNYMEEKEILIDKISEDKNKVLALLELPNISNNVLNRVLNKILLEQVKNIAKELSLDASKVKEQNWSKKYEGQFILKKNEWENFCICFEFLSDDLKNFNYGIKYQLEKYKHSQEETKNEINNRLGGDNNEWYASRKLFEPHDWNNAETIEMLYDDTIGLKIKEKIKEILEKIDGMNL